MPHTHLDVPVNDPSSVKRPQPSQDLLKQLRSEGRRYATAYRPNQGVGVTPPRPVEHHGRRAKDGRRHFGRGTGAAGALLEKRRVDEDVAETNEVAKVYLVMVIDALGA